jgi:hypothetical protein
MRRRGRGPSLVLCSSTRSTDEQPVVLRESSPPPTPAASSRSRPTAPASWAASTSSSTSVPWAWASAAPTSTSTSCEEDIPHVVRAMDNVVDRTRYPLREQEAEAQSKRRMGLGVTGLANALEYLGLPYGSKPPSCKSWRHRSCPSSGTTPTARRRARQGEGGLPAVRRREVPERRVHQARCRRTSATDIRTRHPQQPLHEHRPDRHDLASQPTTSRAPSSRCSPTRPSGR